MTRASTRVPRAPDGTTVIASADWSHTAVCTPSPAGDGTWVVIKRVVPPTRTVGAWFLSSPMHVVLDRVHDLIYPVTVEDEHVLTYDDQLGRVVLKRRSDT